MNEIDIETYITSENITAYKEDIYEPGDHKNNFVACVEESQDTIKSLRSKVKDMDEFWGMIYYDLYNISQTAQSLGHLLIDDMNSSVQVTLEDLTCRAYNCTYSHLNNGYCVWVRDGTAWWVLGSLVAIFGLFLMTFVVWLRRKDLLNPQVEAAKSEEEDDDETNEESNLATGQL